MEGSSLDVEGAELVSEPRIMAARGLRVGDVAEFPPGWLFEQVAELHLYLSRVELVTVGGQRLSLLHDDLVIVHHRTVEIEA